MNENIKNLPETQRPYEKSLSDGVGALSDSELLAVILRSGTQGTNVVSLANQIIKNMEETSYPGLTGLLHISVEDLMKTPGIGKVKAIQLKCIGELSKRIACTAAKGQLNFQNPSSIAGYYMERLRHEEQELMLVMMLDTRNHLLGEQMLTRGTVNATLITPREVFVEALRRHATGLILVHNHPSGDPSPSSNDREVTARIYQAGELLGIRLLDHVVIGDHRYFSFMEEGCMDK